MPISWFKMQYVFICCAMKTKLNTQNNVYLHKWVTHNDEICIKTHPLKILKGTIGFDVGCIFFAKNLGRIPKRKPRGS